MVCAWGPSYYFFYFYLFIYFTFSVSENFPDKIALNMYIILRLIYKSEFSLYSDLYMNTLEKIIWFLLKLQISQQFLILIAPDNSMPIICIFFRLRNNSNI